MSSNGLLSLTSFPIAFDRRFSSFSISFLVKGLVTFCGVESNSYRNGKGSLSTSVILRFSGKVKSSTSWLQLRCPLSYSKPFPRSNICDRPGPRKGYSNACFLGISGFYSQFSSLTSIKRKETADNYLLSTIPAEIGRASCRERG